MAKKKKRKQQQPPSDFMRRLLTPPGRPGGLSVSEQRQYRKVAEEELLGRARTRAEREELDRIKDGYTVDDAARETQASRSELWKSGVQHTRDANRD
jgi:hypothetical protein